MGLYSRLIFPLLCDRAMARPAFERVRAGLLPAAHGDVLEIGIGTGLNLRHYPPAVRRVVGLDPNPGMERRAACRHPMAATTEVLLVIGRADVPPMPFDEASFDTVVATWTMCSIPDVPAALREVHRVLKPGGRLLFVEHGLSPNARTARWQRWLTPIQRRLADGCHLDRDIRALLTSSPLTLERCDEFRMEGLPGVGAHTYVGSARR